MNARSLEPVYGPTYLRPCSCGWQPPTYYARWQMIGSGPLTRVYVWVQCDSIPPCETGGCFATDEEAAKDWNSPPRAKRRRKQ